MKNLLLTGAAMMAFATMSLAQNTATLNQNGSFTSADLNQTGLNNNINAVQNGTGAGSAVIFTRIRQTGPAGTSLNNQVNSNQVGRDHFISAYQMGVSNLATLRQTDQSASVTTNQIGNFNDILSNQRSAVGTRVIAEITQTGNRNYTELTNQTDIIDQVDATFAYIYQTGNDNLAYLTQIGDANTATMSQSVNWNVMVGRQEGTSNKLRITQVGDNATSLLFNYSRVQQNGRGNDSRTFQNGRNNIIDLKVTGNNNFADLSQTGTGQRIRGLNGFDTIGQDGNNNRMTVSQTGSNQSFTVGQTGNSHTAFVLQQN